MGYFTAELPSSKLYQMLAAVPTGPKRENRTFHAFQSLIVPEKVLSSSLSITDSLANTPSMQRMGESEKSSWHDSHKLKSDNWIKLSACTFLAQLQEQLTWFEVKGEILDCVNWPFKVA